MNKINLLTELKYQIKQLLLAADGIKDNEEFVERLLFLTHQMTLLRLVKEIPKKDRIKLLAKLKKSINSISSIERDTNIIQEYIDIDKYITKFKQLLKNNLFNYLEQRNLI